MHAYVFIGRGHWGFTHDETAADLPADWGPWSFFRNAIIKEGEAPSSGDAIVREALLTRGYAVLPIDR